MDDSREGDRGRHAVEPATEEMPVRPPEADATVRQDWKPHLLNADSPHGDSPHGDSPHGDSPHGDDAAGTDRWTARGHDEHDRWDDEPDDRWTDHGHDAHDTGYDDQDQYQDEYQDQDEDDEPGVSRPRPARTAGDLVRTGIRGMGQALVTAGLVVLLFVVYEVWVTDLFSDRQQSVLSEELRETWDDPTVPTLPEGGLSEVPLGQGFAFIRIPRFGEDYVKVILEGTDEDELVEGPGHYVDSAMPGEQGNFALAGHRVGKGSPFLDLDQMQAGDPIVIETEDTWYVYRVLGTDDPNGIPGQQIVLPTDVSVIAPTPNGPLDGPPSGAYLTLTTCHPKFSARERLIVHAVLEGDPIPKSESPDGPPALSEG